ncbi:MAG: CBS domain-containing protein [Acidobacteriota bacterium]|nr:CBS domain-containing protein [Acidobacteriota bacterium]
MKIITTHLSADFDAFAAAVSAVRLFPDHEVLFPGSQEVAVRRFLADTEISFPEVKLRRARTEPIEHAVVVDTSSPSRLGEVYDLLATSGCPITLIDHHMEEEEDGLDATETIVKPVGATCTIIADLYRERGIEPTLPEASLMLMGIYEDTGGLSYRETTPDDLRIAAWLLEQGASLAWVRRWVLKVLQPEQLELLNRMVEATEVIDIAGVPVSLSMIEVDRYHEEAAFVVHRWVEIFEIVVGAVFLVRPPNINLILRSRLPGLHVGRVAQQFGGGGHPTAASARVSDLMPVELREVLLEALAIEMPPPVAAIDIAARKIFSVDDTVTVADTKDHINQLRVNALPVKDTATGDLIGLVTRQTLDRALSHGMDERPVTSAMQPDLPTVPASTPLNDLRDLFLERSYRFGVVEDAGKPAGIITRMELFRRLFEHQYTAGSTLDNRMAGTRPVSQSITRLLREFAPPWVLRVLDATRRVADGQNVPVYLVGGMVRDLLLERANEDVDLVVEGDGIAFAAALAEELGGRHHPHAPFLTAVVTLSDGFKIDVASARTEFYRTPAALPEVATSLIRQDLYRRDFTINSLAVALQGDRYGDLVDFFGGRKDLQRREIRVLHSLSFIDDPTRALRAVRYARRLDFSIAPDTRHLIATALAEGVFDRLSGQRLRRELELLLTEAHPTEALALVARLGLLPAICPDLEWSETIRGQLMEVEGQLAWYELEGLGPAPELWILFLAGLAVQSGADAVAHLAERLQLGGSVRDRVLALPHQVETIVQAADPSLPRSQRSRVIENCAPEALLLAMAEVPLEARRVLADAAEAAVRLELPVTGQQLLDHDVPPGPHIGRALTMARDALVDGVVSADEVLSWAVATAAGLKEEGS